MSTSWDEVAQRVRDELRSALTYIPSSKITVIPSISDYFANNTAQTVIDDLVILIAPSANGSESKEPRLSGYFRKRFEVEIAVVSKMDVNAIARIWGTGKKGIFDVANDVVTALEHKNLGGFAENKSGANFEVPWNMLPLDGRAFTGYQTTYTVVKIEK